MKLLSLLINLTSLWFRSLFLNKERNRILVIFQSIHTGGTRTYFQYLAEFLLNQGKQIVLLANHTELSEELVSFSKSNKISIHTYTNEISNTQWYGSFWRIGFLRFSYSYLKQVCFLFKLYVNVKPEKTFISQGWPFQWFKVLYLPGKKYIVQHVMPLHYFDRGNNLFLKIGLRRRNTFFVAVSDFAKEKMQRYWLGTFPNIQTIYNYYKVKNNHKPALKEKISILTLARVEEGKNPLLWIDIAKTITSTFSNTEFIWAGDGSLLKEAATATKDLPGINFIGFKTDVDKLYSNADIYFEPSLREAFGISVVGAMAWGIPTIATNHGGPVEIVVDGKTGYTVDVSSIEEMTSRLSSLIEDQTLRISMGNSGKNRYYALFSPSIWNSKMENFFTQ